MTADTSLGQQSPRPSEVKRARDALGLSLREAYDAVARYGSADAAIVALSATEAIRSFTGEHDTLRLRIKELEAATAQQMDRVRELEAALAWCIKKIDAEICTHVETYRGGAIWTICRDCEMKWADDRGGFKPYSEPKELAAARAALNQPKEKRE